MTAKNNCSKELRVRRQKIIHTLTWLTGKNDKGEPNNLVYKDVIIDHSRFQILPEDDFLESAMTVNFENENTDDIEFDEEELPDMGPNSNDEDVRETSVSHGLFSDL